jgi:putative FmdB family regulatory protein
MPFYEYECSNCRFYVEVLQKISEQPLKKCPSCGKNALKKLVSAPVFRLKGSGWYETDFKSDQENKRNLAAAEKEEKQPKPAEADGKSEAKIEAKPEGKADSKPDGKPESKPESKPAATPKPTARGTAKKAKSKGAATGKSAGSRRSTSSKSKSSSKRRRGR